MIHPVHGVTIAVGGEIAWNEKHGWKVDPPKEPVPEAPAIVGTITKAKIGRPKKVK